jgi:NADH dehydrogenase
VRDAERLRVHLGRLIDQASAHGADDGTLAIVVVGGGPTGVETAGALAELMHALDRTGRIARPGTVTLVDRGDALLGGFAEKPRRYALEKLTAAGVDVRLGTGVTAVHGDRVELDDGSVLPTQTVIWGGGESASELAADAGPAPGRGGRLDVLPDLRIAELTGAYAVGDVANIASASGATLPQLGSVAQQSGRWAADNILREQNGQETVPFRYHDKGIMAMIGRNAAVAEVGKHRHTVDGPVAFAAWLGVHALLLSGAHSRTDAFLTWAWEYFDRDHAATAEASAAPARIVWGDDPADRPHLTG